MMMAPDLTWIKTQIIMKYMMNLLPERVKDVLKRMLTVRFNLFVPGYTNSTYDNPYFDKETAYKYYNEFMWGERYAKIITLEQAIELLQS